MILGPLLLLRPPSEESPKNSYYPTALKGCRGIVFTHDVRMGGRTAGKKFVQAISQKP